MVLLVRHLSRFYRGASPSERFLLCQSVAPLAAFTAVACLRPVLPHWTLVGYLSLFPLLGRAWETRYRANPTGMNWTIAPESGCPSSVIVP